MASLCLWYPAHIRSPDDHWVPIEICSNDVLAAPCLDAKPQSDDPPRWRPDVTGDHVLVDVLTRWCKMVPRWIKCYSTCLRTARHRDNDIDCNRWPPPPNNHRLSINSLSEELQGVVVGRLCDVLRAEHRAVQATSWRDSKEFPAHCAATIHVVDTRLRDPGSPYCLLTTTTCPNAHDSLGVCLPFGIRCPADGCWTYQHRQLHPLDTLPSRNRMGIHRQTGIPTPFT